MIVKTASSHPVKLHKHLSVFALGINPQAVVGVEIEHKHQMSNGNSFAQLSSEAAENAARVVLKQLTGRLNFSKHQSKLDEEMECLQFGICNYQTQKIVF